MAHPIPDNRDALLPRELTAEALTAVGYPIKAKTLATKATRGGRPPYCLFSGRALYRWGEALLDRLRFYRGAAHLHALGRRAVAELLMELPQSTGDTARILDHLARYRRLTPAMVRAAGGDRCPPRPMHLAERVA